MALVTTSYRNDLSPKNSPNSNISQQYANPRCLVLAECGPTGRDSTFNPHILTVISSTVSPFHVYVILKRSEGVYWFVASAHHLCL